MDSARWKQVEELYDAAMERSAEERSAFLDEACGDDVDLLREVQNLLSYEEPARAFLESSALEITARAVAQKRSTELIGETVGGYRIVSRLGAGGMGEVFLAEDSTLERRVALKFLPVAVESDDRARHRLIREAQAAAQLDHPNVCAIHEVGRHREVSFIVMQYVEGETLASLIKRGPVAPVDSLRIAIQTADALAEAHSHGIIHRDIKPQNIMLTRRGQVKVLDFGLAKLEAGGRPATDDASTDIVLTQPGVIAGTAPYMSPEQLRGETLDGRTDIFSLGAVLYEMLTGVRAFAGSSTAETIAAVLDRDPAPVDQIEGSNQEIQEILNCCLSKDRTARYETANVLAEHLKRALNRVDDESAPTRIQARRVENTARARYRYKLAAFCLLLLTVVGAVLFFSMPRSETIDSIAVLPFAIEGATSDSDYLGEAIPHGIISKLSELPGLKVISPDSSFRYRSPGTDLKRAGDDLGARAFLSGRIVQRGETLWISATLVDSRDDRTLWGEQFNAKPADLIRLQEQISRTISDRLRLKLTGTDRQRLARRHTESAEAHTLYLRGRLHWSKLTLEGVQKSIDLFKEALQIDPSYALAYAGLADSYSYYGKGHEAKAAALEALKLDDLLGEAHASLGWARLLYDWDWNNAETEIARGIELNPSYPAAHHWYAVLLGNMGRYDDAIREARRAQDLDPLSPNINMSLALAYILAKQPDEARAELEEVLELEPGFAAAHSILGLAHERSGKYQKAIDEYQKSRELLGDNQMGMVNIEAAIGRVYALWGRRTEAAAILANTADRAGVSQYLIAEIHAALGDRSRTLEWLDRAYQARDTSLLSVKVNPMFDALHGDPRFDEVVRRVGLSP